MPLVKTPARRLDDQAPSEGVSLRPGDLAGLVLQSVLLAGAMGFTVAVILGQAGVLPRPVAFGTGLEAGLLASYPTMKIVARANGSRLTFATWAGVTLAAAALGMTILLIV
jgi:hypothetical protein